MMLILIQICKITTYSENIAENSLNLMKYSLWQQRFDLDLKIWKIGIGRHYGLKIDLHLTYAILPKICACAYLLVSSRMASGGVIK